MPPLIMILSQLFNYRGNYLSLYHFRAKWIKQYFAFVKFILTFFVQNILRYLKISYDTTVLLESAFNDKNISSRMLQCYKTGNNVAVFLLQNNFY